MKLKVLQKRCAEVGITDEAVADAMEYERPKPALIELLLEREIVVPTPGEAPPRWHCHVGFPAAGRYHLRVYALSQPGAAAAEAKEEAKEEATLAELERLQDPKAVWPF
jgi:hypothetical protein